MVTSNNKPPRPSGPESKLSVSAVAIIVGIMLVVFGLWQLAERLLGPWFEETWRIISLITSIAWPLIIIMGGISLMIIARKGKLELPQNRKFYRSMRNRKLAGVCGGIAEYLGTDPAIVRVATIVLAFICWYVIVSLYLLCWIIIEPDTKNYNNWV